MQLSAAMKGCTGLVGLQVIVQGGGQMEVKYMYGTT